MLFPCLARVYKRWSRGGTRRRESNLSPHGVIQHVVQHDTCWITSVPTFPAGVVAGILFYSLFCWAVLLSTAAPGAPSIGDFPVVRARIAYGHPIRGRGGWLSSDRQTAQFGTATQPASDSPFQRRHFTLWGSIDRLRLVTEMTGRRRNLRMVSLLLPKRFKILIICSVLGLWF